MDGVFEKRELETFFSWIKGLNINTHKTIAIDIGAYVFIIALPDWFPISN